MDTDFGTYHHSTPAESMKLRERAENEFSSLLLTLNERDSSLRILDAGCGLGFLCYVAARLFPFAMIVGVDVFGHGSLLGSSIERAKENMRKLGIGNRVSFLQHDLLKPLNQIEKFDVAISNLVFHNLGSGRFSAYENVFSALKTGGYFIVGDLFPHLDADLEYLERHSVSVQKGGEIASGDWQYVILTLRME